MKIPILIIAYNRPNKLKALIAKISYIKPTKIYVSCDGPKKNNLEEINKIKKIKKIINTDINWESEIKKNYSNFNQGCKLGCINAISWFFEQEEYGIILEEDCIPDLSFFEYAAFLLKKYSKNEEIFLISSDGRATKQFNASDSYYFSRYPTLWGWASWRRSWNIYKSDLKKWSLKDLTYVNDITKSGKTKRFWKSNFKQVITKNFDTWDYQLAYTCFKRKMFTIVPSVNLVSNIGFDNEATHCLDSNSINANLKTFKINRPFNAMTDIYYTKKIDNYYEKYEFYQYSFFIRLLLYIKRTLRNFLLVIKNFKK